MSTLLIRRRRPAGEPVVAGLHGGRHGGEIRSSPVVETIDGTARAGRICASLLEAGVTLHGVRQAVIDPDVPIADLDAIDLTADGLGTSRLGTSRLDERPATVVLGSHLVNAPDEARRLAFARLAARHLAPDGTLLLEHHPLDWAETAADLQPTPGGAVGMLEVRRDPPFVSAVSVFEVGGRVVRQPFTARVLSEQELEALLAAVGLAARRRLAATWLEAGSSRRSRSSAG